MTGSADTLIGGLTGVGLDAVRRGLVLASGGNLSARLPGEDGYVVTAAGTWLDRLEPSDFTVMNLDGEVVRGNPVPSTEWRLHWRTYQARTDVNAIVHLHPQLAVVLDALGHPIRLLTLDHVAYLRRVERVSYLPTGTDELAMAAASAAASCNALILRYHGCSTLGDTLEMAYRRALNLEEAALATFRCLQLGDRDTTFPPELLDTVRHG
jgi:ribulose-5-phosphate 4-epimerase/fuculose-1-phosphate aldolase